MEQNLKNLLIKIINNHISSEYGYCKSCGNEVYDLSDSLLSKYTNRPDILDPKNHKKDCFIKELLERYMK